MSFSLHTGNHLINHIDAELSLERNVLNLQNLCSKERQKVNKQYIYTYMIFTLLYIYIVHQQNNLSLNKQEKCMQRTKIEYRGPLP